MTKGANKSSTPATGSLPVSSAMAQLTTQQLAACCVERDRWLAVSAGAGSGKTAVLANRMVALLEQGASLSSIVAITFTRKAAQEMATRVENLLNARVGELREIKAGAKDSEPEVARRLHALENAREEFHRHRITTIDGFCRTQLAANALEAGIEPGFAVLDEHQGRQLDHGAIDAVRRLLTPYARGVASDNDGHRARKREGEAYAELHRWFSAKQVDEMLGALLRRPGVLELALAAIGCWPLPTDPNVVSTAVMDQAELLLPTLRAAIESTFPWTEAFTTMSQDAADPRREAARLGRGLMLDLKRVKQDQSAWARYFATLIEACKSDELWGPDGGLAMVQGLRGVGGKLNADLAACLDEHGVSRAGVTNLVNALKSAGSSGEGDYDAEVEQRSGRLLWALASLLPLLNETHARLKAGALTFADLKRTMLEFVQPGPARDGMPARTERQADHNASSVASGIEWMMIDEFQDTDPEQLKLFLRIVEATADRPDGGINLFVVGDEKQSIYRFRGADAGVFRAATERVQMEARSRKIAARPLLHPMSNVGLVDSDGAGMTLDRQAALLGSIRLSANFRTDGIPLRVGNVLFERIFKMLDGTDEGAREPQVWDCEAQNLECGKRLPNGSGAEGGFVEIVPLTVHSAEDDDEQPESESAPGVSPAKYADLAASLREARCATQVVQRLKSEGKIKGWGDVAVLVRKNVEVDLVRAALAQDRIPCVTTGGSALFQRQEVRDVLSLAAALTDPSDDMAWMGLLRSPLFGVTDEAMLFVIKSSERRRFTSLSQLLLSPSARAAWRPAIEALDSYRVNEGFVGGQDLPRLEDAAERIRRWRRSAEDARPVEVVRTALEECGAWAHGVGVGHAQRMANLELLLKLIAQKEAEGCSLAAVAAWLRDQIDDSAPHSEGQTERDGVDDSTASADSVEDAPEGSTMPAGCVSVMTVHQAKGKQFKVVVLPFLCGRGRPNHQSSFDVGEPAPSLASAPGGKFAYVATDAPTLSTEPQPKPVACRVLKLDTALMERAELRRVFYTAWTRAEEGIVAILAAKKPTKSGHARPAPDPDHSSLTAGDLILSALSASPDSGLMAAEVRSGLERLSRRHQSLAKQANTRELKTAYEAHAAALEAVCVRDEQVIAPPRVSPDTKRRALVGTLAQGASVLDPQGRSIDVIPDLPNDALPMILPLPEPSRSKWLELPSVEEYGIVEGKPGHTVRAWTTKRRSIPSRPVSESYGVADARQAATRLADNEFGIIVHEALRLAIRDGVLTSERAKRNDWTTTARRTVLGIAARHGYGADRDPAQMDDLVSHIGSGIRLLQSLGTPIRVLTEFPLLVGRVERRVDCALELRRSEWLVVDFKTSASDPKRADSHAMQLREYAALLTHVLRSHAEPPSLVSTAIAHTMGDGEWSGRTDYRGPRLDELSLEAETNALAAR